MTDIEKQSLPQHMQQAVHFVEMWQLSRTLDEFLEAMGKSGTTKDRQWACTQAAFFRCKGIELRSMKRGRSSGPLLDYDFVFLQVVAKRVMAELAGKKDEASMLVDDFTKARLEASHILAELRKYKSSVVDRELNRTGV